MRPPGVGTIGRLQPQAAELSTTAEATVNEHYLDHVMTVAEDRRVEAAEDIYASNGMKLVAKGYAIHRHMRERLLEHKLNKPLEDSLAVADGVTGAHCLAVAERLLDTHPVLRSLCTSGKVNPMDVLSEATFAGRLQTLMTVYNEHRSGKLDHALCVALIGMSLAQRLAPDDSEGLQVMLVAGLAHDVGELYIDPRYLVPGTPLSPQEWRHIVAHPVIAHDLLKDLNGLARPAAALIVDHHERLDGFGYPAGLKQPPPKPQAQVLGVAEMLAGLLDKGPSFLQHADVAVKLIPGEFSRPVIDVVSQAYKNCRAEDHALTDGANIDQALQTSLAVAERFQRMAEVQAAFEPLVQKSSPPFKALWQQALLRFERIRRAWSSTGLDVQPDTTWLRHESPDLQREVAIVLMEVRWRLRELERETQARVARLAATELPLLERYLQEVRQRVGEITAAPGVATPPSAP
jgi:HD-GYP domain-containing protein (c-di-GMP phosphodiesterase class II)